jgi:hypothetical protein
VMANSLFRRVKLLRDDCAPAWHPHANRPNSSRRASFPEIRCTAAARFGNFSGVTEPVEVARVSYRGTAPADKMAASRVDIFPTYSSGDRSMVITSAHIQPIVALIAGVLILIMPRFLNLVVAIYLIFIGLAGLGLFKMFHV